MIVCIDCFKQFQTISNKNKTCNGPGSQSESENRTWHHALTSKKKIVFYTLSERIIKKRDLVNNKMLAILEKRERFKNVSLDVQILQSIELLLAHILALRKAQMSDAFRLLANWIERSLLKGHSCLPNLVFLSWPEYQLSWFPVCTAAQLFWLPSWGGQRFQLWTVQMWQAQSKNIKLTTNF